MPGDRDRADEPGAADRLAALEVSTLANDARISELAAEVEALHGKLEHRSTIEQAKGVLMHSMGIGEDAAFAVLVAASQRENVKLYKVAERIAAAQDAS